MNSTIQLSAPARRCGVLCGAVAILVLAFGAAGCGGDPAVSAADVEQAAEEQFGQQFPVDSVECPEDLPAEVDASITCVLVSEGNEFEMTATTTSVDGEDAQFDLELTAEL